MEFAEVQFVYLHLNAFVILLAFNYDIIITGGDTNHYTMILFPCEPLGWPPGIFPKNVQFSPEGHEKNFVTPPHFSIFLRDIVSNMDATSGVFP